MPSLEYCSAVCRRVPKSVMRTAAAVTNILQMKSRNKQMYKLHFVILNHHSWVLSAHVQGSHFIPPLMSQKSRLLCVVQDLQGFKKCKNEPKPGERDWQREEKFHDSYRHLSLPCILLLHLLPLIRFFFSASRIVIVSS